jgi:hypothetical protein
MTTVGEIVIVNDPSTDTYKPPSQIFLSAAIAEHQRRGGSSPPEGEIDKLTIAAVDLQPLTEAVRIAARTGAFQPP